MITKQNSIDYNNALPKSIQILSLAGKVVDKYLNVISQKFSISTNKLAQGLYIVESFSETGQGSQKICGQLK